MTARFIAPVVLTGIAALAAGCSSGSAERTAEAIASPVTAPINAAVNNTMPLPQQSEYTYFRKVPGTNVYESFKSDHPLTETEQDNLKKYGTLTAPEGSEPQQKQ